jgi:hypothetical protein
MPTRSRLDAAGWIPITLAVLLSAAFIVMARPGLDTLLWDYDEGWFVLDARFILRGQRPFPVIACCRW